MEDSKFDTFNVYEVTDIIWDSDVVSLPKTILLGVPQTYTDGVDIEQYISDALSDHTGYCHKGFATHPEIKY